MLWAEDDYTGNSKRSYSQQQLAYRLIINTIKPIYNETE